MDYICFDCGSVDTTPDGKIIHRPNLFIQTKHRVVTKEFFASFFTDSPKGE